MSLRFPLYAKILLWLFLNLVLLGLVIIILFTVQFRFGLDLVLAGKAGDRIQGIASVILADLRENSRADWNEILSRYSEAYGASFFVFRNDGTQLAGESTVLPAEIVARLRSVAPPRPGFGRGEPGPPGEPQPEREPPPRPPGFSRPPRPLFFARTTNPVRYWVGVPAMLRGPSREGPIGPSVLLISSGSIHGGGLFLDPAPLIFGGIAALLLSVLFWFPLVRGITKSIHRATEATEQIAQGKFDVRLSETRKDEIGSLACSVNSMAARLEGYVSGQKRFLGDIAHELCSPIGRMQVALAILEQRIEGAQKDYISDVREELDQMSGLVSELLAFSKASLGQATSKTNPVSILEAVQRAAATENKNGAQIEIAIPPGLRVLADANLLNRALGNVLRNAIRYASQSGPIRIHAFGNDDAVGIAVQDQGDGVPPESLARLFDPFYRVDSARTRETGGVGLGLTIVKTCVEACGGSVSCRNLQPKGFEVTLRLPQA